MLNFSAGPAMFEPYLVTYYYYLILNRNRQGDVCAGSLFALAPLSYIDVAHLIERKLQETITAPTD